MSVVLVDDHLLRDLLADFANARLRRVVTGRSIATTNLYYARLCRSVVAARGGQLTGHWTSSQRAALGEVLTDLPDDIVIVPMREIAHRMAQLVATHPLSTLGSEAIAAAEVLGARLVVWAGDDGPAIRAAASARRVGYVTVAR